MKAAALQMNTLADVQANLEQARVLLEEARAQRFSYEIQDEEPGTQTVRQWGDTAVVTAKLRIKGHGATKPFDRSRLCPILTRCTPCAPNPRVQK